MAKQKSDFSIRSFVDGDETVLASLFNRHVADFVGPIRVTPRSWRRQFRQRGWTGPSLDEDKECCRIAERDGEILGYALTDYQPVDAAIIQELCTTEIADAQQVAEALIKDAEERALERDQSLLILWTSHEDGRAMDAGTACGFQEGNLDGDVFMVTIIDLVGFLNEIRGALSNHIGESSFHNWTGIVQLTSGEQTVRLQIRNGSVQIVSGAPQADIAVHIDPDWLPPLLFGRATIGYLYLQNAVSVRADDVRQALRIIHTLFPPLPMYLPRAQWW